MFPGIPGSTCPGSGLKIRARGNPGTLDSAAVYSQGKAAGGATFRRPEGCWYHEGLIYLSDTNGGNAGRGQIFVFDPARSQLRLIFESPDADVLDHPDNIAMTPRGGLVICEDRPRNIQRVLALNTDGELVRLAANNVVLNGEVGGLAGDFRNREWAGACFSADGRWLFLNIQTPGITVAVTGPWEALRI